MQVKFCQTVRIIFVRKLFEMSASISGGDALSHKLEAGNGVPRLGTEFPSVTLQFSHCLQYAHRQMPLLNGWWRVTVNFPCRTLDLQLMGDHLCG